jgi:putative ABC transport system substrate-binding protein
LSRAMSLRMRRTPSFIGRLLSCGATMPRLGDQMLDGETRGVTLLRCRGLIRLRGGLALHLRKNRMHGRGGEHESDQQDGQSQHGGPPFRLGMTQRLPQALRDASVVDLNGHRPYRPDMDRRRFLLTSLAGVFAAPLAGQAQPALPTLVMLLTGTPAATTSEIAAFTQELRSLGWIEGQKLAIDRRWADESEKLVGLAADAVRATPAVILAAGPDATRAAQLATSTIPIVMIGSTDPRVMGAASLARPGGNLTGLTIGQPEVVSEKRLQLVKETLPTLARVAVLWDVKKPADGPGLAGMVAAARVLGVRLQHLDVKSASGFASAFAAAKRDNAEVVLLVESPRAVANRAVIAELGLKQGLPVMSQFSRIVEAGGLMSYGPDLTDLFRRAAAYVDKILRGAKPADLPIEQPTKFELVINLKTAKALGLTIPPSLLLRADHVIE